MAARVSAASNWGGDTHDIWYDPMNADRICVTHDGGMWMTFDHGRTSNRVTLPIGQMYHVAVDNDAPYKVYSNMQDDGTMRGASNVVESGPNVPGMENAGGRGGFGGGRGGAGGTWEHNLGGCESGFTLPDLTNTDIVWASCYGDEVTRYDAKRSWRAPSAPTSILSIRRRIKPNTAATGRRRWPSIPSTTIPSTSAAR